MCMVVAFEKPKVTILKIKLSVAQSSLRWEILGYEICSQDVFLLEDGLATFFFLECCSGSVQILLVVTINLIQ